NASGLEPSLTTVSLLEPGQETIWVDDQVQASGGTPASASALVGEAAQLSGTIPQMSVAGTHLASEAGAEATLSGTVENHSQTTQQNLVVYAVARRASKIVAAGRAVLPEVTAGTNSGTNVPFQIYFVGNPSGAQIQTSAPATTFGTPNRAAGGWAAGQPCQSSAARAARPLRDALGQVPPAQWRLPRLSIMPSITCATVSHASTAASSDSKMSFQRITTIGSAPPPANSEATPSRSSRSPSFSRQWISTR